MSLGVQVFFVNDPSTLGWRVILMKEPRSRRVVLGVDEGMITAAGRDDGLELAADAAEDVLREVDEEANPDREGPDFDCVPVVEVHAVDASFSSPMRPPLTNDFDMEDTEAYEVDPIIPNNDCDASMD